MCEAAGPVLPRNTALVEGDHEELAPAGGGQGVEPDALRGAAHCIRIWDAEFAFAQRVEETVEREALSGAIDAKFWTVLGRCFRQGTHHAVLVLCCRFKQIGLAVATKHDPNVTALSPGDTRLPGQTASRNEIRVIPELHELSPRPDRVILAISSTKMLEGARVLPKVWLVKEFRILNVLTLDEPVSYRIDAANIDATLALEVPIEIMSRAPAIVTHGNPVLEASPRILRWEHPKKHSP